MYSTIFGADQQPTSGASESVPSPQVANPMQAIREEIDKRRSQNWSLDELTYNAFMNAICFVKTQNEPCQAEFTSQLDTACSETYISSIFHNRWAALYKGLTGNDFQYQAPEPSSSMSFSAAAA